MVAAVGFVSLGLVRRLSRKFFESPPLDEVTPSVFSALVVRVAVTTPMAAGTAVAVVQPISKAGPNSVTEQVHLLDSESSSD